MPQPPLPGPLLVGFSGGLDSTALLHRLASMQALRARGLRAIHVHHGLHRDAETWAEHCRRACAALDVPLTIARVAVRTGSGQGVEGAARLARHAAFEAELLEGEILALAHHRDDQAETFLLRALRGSGVDGIGAMRAWRHCGPGWLWRPLLDVPRETLSRYAQQHGLAWIEDPSNAGSEPDRNYLRHRVLPRLRERWPHADEALARSAALAAQAAGLLADGDAAALAAVVTPDPAVIDVERLLEHPPARRARLLRLWISRLALPPLPAEGVTRIEATLLGELTDSVPEFAWSGAAVRRWRGLLHAARRAEPLPPGYRAAWDGLAPLRLPTGDLLALEGVRPPGAGGAVADPWPLLVHARLGGERIVLPGRKHSHALKHVLQALGVPPWLRERLPLLSSPAGALLAAGDLVLAAPFDRQLEANGWRLTWRPMA